MAEALIHESRISNEHHEEEEEGEEEEEEEEEEVIVVEELLDSYRAPNYVTASEESVVGPYPELSIL
jgi:hypothetical protein